MMCLKVATIVPEHVVTGAAVPAVAHAVKDRRAHPGREIDGLDVEITPAELGAERVARSPAFNPIPKAFQHSRVLCQIAADLHHTTRRYLPDGKQGPAPRLPRPATAAAVR